MAADNSCSSLSPINGNFLNGVDEHLILTEFNNTLDAGPLLLKGPNEMPAVSLARDEETNYEQIFYYPKPYTGEKVLEIIIPQSSLLMYVDERWPNDGTDFVPMLYVGKWFSDRNSSSFVSIGFKPEIFEFEGKKMFKFPIYAEYNIEWDKIIITRPGYVFNNNEFSRKLESESGQIITNMIDTHFRCMGKISCILQIESNEYNLLVNYGDDVILKVDAIE